MTSAAANKHETPQEVDVPLAQSAQPPIVKIAAGAVIILCALGAGVITGLIPGVSSQDAQMQPAATPGTPAPAQPAAKAPTRVAASTPRTEKPATPTCFNCGVVESVSTVEVKGEASGAGAVIGGVTGLIVGNQIGDGRGKTLAKVAGAAGGAYAGHQIEKNAKKTVQYRIAVRMNDGTLRTVQQPSGDGLSAGTRVKLIDNTVVVQ